MCWCLLTLVKRIIISLEISQMNKIKDRYVAKLSKAEANYILIAYHRHKRYLDYDTELCSHLHEKDFLYRNNTLILEYPKDTPFHRTLKMIHENIADIAANEIFSKRIVSEFQDVLKTSRFAQTLLWWHWLLVNCHKREECSEYMSLAFKFKLFAYWQIEYGDIQLPTTVIETMTEFLNYISFYKCKEKVFTSCLCVFSCCGCFNNSLEDYLEPVLPKIFYVAHKLHFNIFKIWDSEFTIFNFKKYAQESLVINVKRFLTIAEYGYEDNRFEADVELNLIFLRVYDRNNLFDFESWRNVKSFHKMYRSLQVLVLYTQATYEKTKHSQDVFDKVLYILWETIADPYLTPRHFTHFEKLDPFPDYLKVWRWYSKIVLKDRTPECLPRSLKHLARCSIRRTLTACAQLPFAVAGLDIPLTLKSYLLLE